MKREKKSNQKGLSLFENTISMDLLGEKKRIKKFPECQKLNLKYNHTLVQETCYQKHTSRSQMVLETSFANVSQKFVNLKQRLISFKLGSSTNTKSMNSDTSTSKSQHSDVSSLLTKR